MARRHSRRGGRTTPKGTRPDHLRPVPGSGSGAPPGRHPRGPEPDDTEVAIVDDIIDGAGRDLIGEADPIAVETWASGLIAMFDDVRRQAALAGMELPPFEAAILDRCAERGDLAAMAVASGLAAVAPAPVDQQAAKVAHQLVDPDAPRWIRDVGRSEPSRAWSSADPAGAQESIIIEYARGADRHALLVLVDYMMGGQAKDAWIATDADEVLEAWRTDGVAVGLRIEEIAVIDGLERVRDALDAADAAPDDDVERSETFAEHRALVRGRLARADIELAPPPVSGASNGRHTPPNEPGPATRPGPTPVPTPTAEEAAESATDAPVLARFDTLAEFYGDGRALTQTGQVRLADARALVDALGTADVIDPTIGDRTFRTKSAAELTELAFMVRWATAAGALRRRGNKLIATDTWQRLAPDPLARWQRAADALPDLGPMATLMAQAHQRYRDPDEIMDEFAPEILRTLFNGEVAYEELLDGIMRVADERYEWVAPYMKDPDVRRRSFDGDLARLVEVLGWAGIATRTGAVAEPDRHRRTGTRQVGGILALTPVGRWWLAPG